MTNTQRLDNVENELETVKQLLVSTASYAESSNSRLDRLVERQDLTQRQLDGLALSVQSMGEKIDRFVDKTDDFIDKTDDFIETTKARNAVLDGIILELRDNQVSTNAAVERLERILEQLLKPKE
ncbi:MAG: hypothetical protein V7K14_21030 [Nostoc sp.]|uniref:hypothetical protein n=1 Tax=Nostoc sp. TaxID=1180 RepID=UPI002FFC00BA